MTVSAALSKRNEQCNEKKALRVFFVWKYAYMTDRATREFMGFEPFFGPDSEILILGSFPSVISRRENFYYANPRNRFWSTLALLFGEETPKDVDEKKSLLKRRHIALWDIVAECDIRGSLDGNIKNYVVADLGKILSVANINRIFLNGQTAYKIFKKHYPELIPIATALPSTSPANVSFRPNMWELISLPKG